MATCAYCKKDKKLTKEHVWPDCFLKKRQHISAHFSVKGEKVHGADYVVKDVCEDCNSIILSELDKYFCELTDKYFQNTIDPDEDIYFEYDYNLLSRALLKIAYNTARAGVSDPTALSNASSYILGESTSFNGLIILLELVGPNEIIAIGEHDVIKEVVPPLGYRSALMKLTTPNGHKVLSRLVSVDAYYFHLLVPLRDLTADEINQIKDEALGTLDGAVHINDEGIVKVKVCDRIWVNTIFPRIEAYRKDYKIFFETERNKRSN
jgi:hypothetical protein